MTLIQFRTAQVTVSKDTVTAVFNDGKTNEFYIPGKDDNYKQIAKWAGYSDDWERYAIEHELTHHFIADNLGWDYSWAVWTQTWFDHPWPNYISWEEHIVNHLQRYTKLGVSDPVNVLPLVFGERLDPLRAVLVVLWKKVLDKPAKIIYNHETQKIEVS